MRKAPEEQRLGDMSLQRTKKTVTLNRKGFLRTCRLKSSSTQAENGFGWCTGVRAASTSTSSRTARIELRDKPRDGCNGDAATLALARPQPPRRLVPECLAWFVSNVVRRKCRRAREHGAGARSGRLAVQSLDGNVQRSLTGTNISHLRQPNVKANVSTPASRNSISNVRSTIGVGCRISWYNRCSMTVPLPRSSASKP